MNTSHHFYDILYTLSETTVLILGFLFIYLFFITERTYIALKKKRKENKEREVAHHNWHKRLHIIQVIEFRGIV